MSHRARKARKARNMRRVAAHRLEMVGRRTPTAEDSVEIAVRYMTIARAALGSRDEAAKLVAEYLGPDPAAGSVRLWYFASVGPVLVGTGMRQLNPQPLDPEDFWAFERLPGAADDPDAAVAAATVVRWLNDDEPTMHDLYAAHYDAAFKRDGWGAAQKALIGMVICHLGMLARLLDAGAYPGVASGPSSEDDA